VLRIVVHIVVVPTSCRALRTAIVVRTIINYQSLLMHSVSVFTMLSYCCRTILCDNDVTKCVQSVDTQAASSSLRSTVHIIMLRHSTSTLYTMYQHCACPLCGPPGESGQHQQVVKLYSHSTKQPCQAKAPARLVGPVLLRSAAGRVGSLGCRAGRLGCRAQQDGRHRPGLRFRLGGEALARAASKRGRPHAGCCGFGLERLASTAYAHPRTALGKEKQKKRGGWVLCAFRWPLHMYVGVGFSFFPAPLANIQLSNCNYRGRGGTYDPQMALAVISIRFGLCVVGPLGPADPI
jgi:hypothetical protein